MNTESKMTPEQKEELRISRIKRHNEVQLSAPYIPIHSTPDPTAWIRHQLKSKPK